MSKQKFWHTIIVGCDMKSGNQLNLESGFCELIRKVCAEVTKKNLDRATEDTISGIFNELFCADTKIGFRPYAPLEEQGYTATDTLLEKTFVDRGRKRELEDSISEVMALRKELLSHVTEQRPFPSFSDIVAYLDGYYSLLKQLLLSSDLLQDSGEAGKNIIQNILNVDMALDGDHACVSLYAPIVLDGLAHLYGAVGQYARSAVALPDERCEKDYQEALVSKTLRYFNWMIAKDGKLMRAAILPSYPEKWADMRQTLDIPVRTAEEWDNYEGIGELRLLDKILYEIKWRLDKFDKPEPEFRAVLIGDIEYRPMKQLCSLVNYYFSNGAEYKGQLPEGFKVSLRVLTDREITDECHEGFVHCSFALYRQHLRQADTVKQLADKNDVLFILDSCDLYTPMTVAAKDKGYIRQRFGEESYHRDYYCSGGGRDLSRNGGFAGLVEDLYIFSYSGKHGGLVKSLNLGLLHYLEGCCPEGSRKSIYLYASDLAAFQAADCDESQIIRIEQYNDKQIAIMRISDLKEGSLPTVSGGLEKTIVFTLWQLVKHIAVRDIDDFLLFFGLADKPDRTGIFTLLDTLVGIDYSGWPERLVFSYELPKEPQKLVDGYEKKVEECIKNEIMPYFKEGSDDMFRRYFIESFSSFLYSAAKDVNDMLFLHLFKNKHSLLKGVELALKNEIRADLEGNLPERCKYSQKQYYYQILEDYDTSSQEFALKYWKLKQLKQAEPELSKKIFGNIKAACERNTYTNSYIYRKIAKGI